MKKRKGRRQGRKWRKGEEGWGGQPNGFSHACFEKEERVPGHREKMEMGNPPSVLRPQKNPKSSKPQIKMGKSASRKARGRQTPSLRTGAEGSEMVTSLFIFMDIHPLLNMKTCLLPREINFLFGRFIFRECRGRERGEASRRL